MLCTTNSPKTHHWKSTKQPTVALSICKIEYMDRLQEYAPVKIFGDNQSALALSRDPVHRQRCQHIDIKCHFMGDALHNGSITIIHCLKDDMIADISTGLSIWAKIKQKTNPKDFYSDFWLSSRVFANGPGDRGSISGRVISKTQNVVLDTFLLNTQHYKVRIKSKVEQSRERSRAFPYTSV